MSSVQRPFVLVYFHTYSGVDYAFYDVRNEAELRSHILERVVEDRKARLINSIETEPIEKVIAYWIRRGKNLEAEGEYGCVAIIEGKHAASFDQAIPGENDDSDDSDEEM